MLVLVYNGFTAGFDMVDLQEAKSQLVALFFLEVGAQRQLRPSPAACLLVLQRLSMIAL